MLTFFEYLRQRAFESVLAGASEALTYLEQQRALTERPRQLPFEDLNTTHDDELKPPRKRADVSKELSSVQGKDQAKRKGTDGESRYGRTLGKQRGKK